MSIDGAIASAITVATGEAFVMRSARAVGGGCINCARIVEDGRRRYFVKSNTGSHRAWFEAEADGLAALARAGALRVPEVIALGTAGHDAYLILEYLDLGGDSHYARLGEQLAAQHRVCGPRFGWPLDNFIGATPQPNAAATDWPSFFVERRLRPQLQLAHANGSGTSLHAKGTRLEAKLCCFFSDYTPQPSLLHGDLWSGNAGFLSDGMPVVFDPATYWGDREADIAMTELFGGFPSAFYAAYRSAWPLDPGYAMRRDLYNLYHILNHFNLFGGGYLGQAEKLIDRLLAHLRG